MKRRQLPDYEREYRRRRRAHLRGPVPDIVIVDHPSGEPFFADRKDVAHFAESKALTPEIFAPEAVQEALERSAVIAENGARERARLESALEERLERPSAPPDRTGIRSRRPMALIAMVAALAMVLPSDAEIDPTRRGRR